MNRLRREHPALQSFANLTFYNAWNDNILYYGKMTPAKDDFVLFAVNLDPHNGQGADFEVPLWEFGLPDEAAIEAEDLVTGNRFTWHGKIQHVWLDPQRQSLRHLAAQPAGSAGAMNDSAGTEDAARRGAERHERDDAVDRDDPRLVQGRHHLPAPRQGLPGLRTTTASATSRG